MTDTPTVIKNPTWWRRRTLMERHCTILTAAALILSIVLIIVLAIVIVKDSQREEMIPTLTAVIDGDTLKISSSKPGYTDKKEICLTPGCVKSASLILNSMDSSQDPCNDFYKFACGRYLKETNIPEDKTSVNAFSTINDALNEQLKTIITEPSKPDEPKPFRMAKNLFQACMNESLIEEIGLTKFKELIKNLGGWPVLEGDSWNESTFNWKDNTYRFKDYGHSVDYFIDFSVTIDLLNSSTRVISLDQASLGLSREYLVKGLDDKVVQAYFSYMVDIAVLLGANRSHAESELKESLFFEVKLANISLPPEERRNATKLYNPMTIPELQKRYPSVPWAEYFRTLLPESVDVKPDEVAIVYVPSFISDLEAILSNTPKRVQANYLLWMAVAESVSYLTADLRKRELDYATAITGRTERGPRWKECLGISAGSLSLAVGSLYVKRFFKEDAKKAALEMVDGIRAEMYKILSEVEWMDEKTRRNALEKAKSVTTHIAYPDELLEIKNLEKIYQKLEVSPDNYLDSMLNLSKFALDYSFNKLREPVNKTDWLTHGMPAVVNAFYSAIENSIQFPAGILQGTFFSNDRPRYLNFGAIGFIISHEITHGFDDEGRQFDKEGNLLDWWYLETKKRYLEKATCIIEQYGNYTVEEVGLQLNGINTQGENIADNGGIKQAYRAYNTWVKEHGEEPRLPGLQEYSPQQLFWINAAKTWCSKYRPEALKMEIITGYHSPGEFRVLGALSNREEFAKDFECPLGTKMNPVKKCHVW